MTNDQAEEAEWEFTPSIEHHWHVRLASGRIVSVAEEIRGRHAELVVGDMLVATFEEISLTHAVCPAAFAAMLRDEG